MKNIPVGDIKPKDDEDDVQVIDPPSSSNVPQDGDKDGRVEMKMSTWNFISCRGHTRKPEGSARWS